jgi:hypothetical protein
LQRRKFGQIIIPVGEHLRGCHFVNKRFSGHADINAVPVHIIAVRPVDDKNGIVSSQQTEAGITPEEIRLAA